MKVARKVSADYIRTKAKEIRPPAGQVAKIVEGEIHYYRLPLKRRTTKEELRKILPPGAKAIEVWPDYAIVAIWDFFDAENM